MPDKNKKLNSKEEAINTYMQSVGNTESSNNPNAKNKNSSATGIYQFTATTWKDLQKRLGKKLDILNPKDQQYAMREFTRINADALEKNGLPVTPANLYTTHFLGTTGGPKFLKNLQANPNELATKYVSDSVAKANSNLFYNNDNPVSAADLYNTLSDKIGGSSQETIPVPGFIPQQEFQETQIDNTSVQQPAPRRDIKLSKPLTENEQPQTQERNFDAREATKSQLGLSNTLDFLPQDINLAFNEDQPNQEQEDINMAKYGGKMKSCRDGGNVSTNLSDGLLNEFNEGDRHENNKYGGIPQGVGKNGELNTVEEGETKFNNYVFSDTLKINQSDIDNLFLPKEIKPNMTYAEASKKLNDHLVNNPNDRIVKKTIQKQLDSLTLGNEKARLAKEKLDINLGSNPLDTSGDLEDNKMFLGGEAGEVSGMQNFNLGANNGLSAISAFASGDDKAGQDALKGLAKSGLAMGADALAPGTGQFVAPVFDMVDGLISNKDRNEMARKRSFMAQAKYNNDFRYGGPDGEQPFPNDSQGTFSDEGITNQLVSQYNAFPNGDFKYSAPIGVENKPYETFRDWSFPQPGTEGMAPANTTTNKSQFRPKGKSTLQYAPVLGDFLNYMDAKNDKPEVENLNKLNARFKPEYADEKSLQNIVSNDFDNSINSLTNASNGSASALRSNILAAGSNRAKALSDAYLKVDEINRNQNLQGQQYNLGIDQFNIGQDNQERDINARNRSAVEDRLRMARDSMFKDVGALGKEETYDNRLYNLTGGYDSQGQYDPDRKPFWEQLGLGDKKDGGFLFTKKKKLEEEFTNKYR